MSVLVKAWKMELFLYECPGIPKKGISKPKSYNTLICNYQVCL